MFRELDMLVSGNTLSPDSSSRLMEYLCLPETSDTERISFLASLLSTGVTPAEMAGFSRTLKLYGDLGPIHGCTDIVGTGGDGMNTFNVSTCASIVASSMGIRIAKHGNRAVSGMMGSADFLARLGYDFEFDQREAEMRLERTGYLFILAPVHNRAFSLFARARKLLGTSTVFNLMGPLTNPVDPEISIIGCQDGLSGLYAETLLESSRRGAVISSSDGMDEISPFGRSRMVIVGENLESVSISGKSIAGELAMKDVRAEDQGSLFGLAMAGLSGENASAARFIALNTAPAVLLNGFADTFEEAYRLSLDQILSGKALSHTGQIVGGEVHA